MATLSLPTNPSLVGLRREARRLQKAVRAGDPAARQLVAVHGFPDPDGLPLHAAQLTVARMYGFASWPRLVRYFDVVAELGRPANALPVRVSKPDLGTAAAAADASGGPSGGPSSLPEISADFSRYACLDYTDDRPAHAARADRLRRAHPELTRVDIWAAAAGADPSAVRALLAGDPARADAVGGPYRWTPLCYLTYSRATASRADVLATATELLDAGADPDAGYLWGNMPIPFTVLTGVFGDGEQGPGRCPPHPHADALARLLLDRGADPNDGQTLYNRMFTPDDGHLRLLFGYGLGTGDGGPWRRRLGPDVLDSPSEMLARQLDWAVAHGFRDRVSLLLANGVDPEVRGRDGRRVVDVAASNGDREMVAALVAAGAEPPGRGALDTPTHQTGTADTPTHGSALDTPTHHAADPEAVAALTAALLANDPALVDRLTSATPGLLDAARAATPGLIARAYTVNRFDALPLLLHHGWSVNGRYGGSTALHEAAWRDDVRAIRTLLAAGADRSLRDARFDATPLGWAEHGERPAAAEVLRDDRE